jgi:hypothetical protein
MGLFGKKKEKVYVPKRAAIDFEDSSAERRATKVALKKGVNAAYDAEGYPVLTTYDFQVPKAYKDLLKGMDVNEAIRTLYENGAYTAAQALEKAKKNQWQ